MPHGRRAGTSALAAAAVGLATVLAAACSSSGGAWPAWTPEAGPAANGAVEVGALMPTPNGWLAVGGVHHDADRAPGLWRSAASGAWTSITVQPVSYYGERSLLHFAALAPDGSTTVAVGWASGGAHGNPRTATWSLLGGALREQPALFELFGGEQQIDLVGIASLGSTWVILGNRSDVAGHAGGGLWRSTDGVTFSIVDAPALASAPGESVRVNGVAALPDGRGLVAVGERATNDEAAHPVAWSSTDGEHWQRDDVADLVPDNAGVSRSLSLVTTTPSGPVAVGIDDEGAVQHYRSVVRDASGRWRLGGTFGATTNDELPKVGAIAPVGGRTVALVKVRGQYRLFWSEGSTEHWHPGSTPEPMPADNATSVVLAGRGTDLDLVVNRAGGAAWWATGL